MATTDLHTPQPVALEWRTGFQHRDVEPVDASGLDYLLDGDDPLEGAARSNLSIDETTEILDGFWAAFDRAQGSAA